MRAELEKKLAHEFSFMRRIKDVSEKVMKHISKLADEGEIPEYKYQIERLKRVVRVIMKPKMPQERKDNPAIIRHDVTITF